MAHLAWVGWVVSVLVAASVSIATFLVCARIFDSRRVRQRYATTRLGGLNAQNGSVSGRVRSRFGVSATSMGLDAGARRRLRMDLVRAGYFSPYAPVVFTIVRSIAAVSIPLCAQFLIYWRFAAWGGILKLGIMVSAFLIAYYLGPAYLDRRRRLLETEYRRFFPDFLDMLVVCVDAGLSLEAALERVGQEMCAGQVAFRTNLELMRAEMGAGKTTIEALRDFSRRLGLSEAASLVTLLQQSLELGTDVSASLSTFSEEMRDKRMSRAEERAHALPVKMTIPLALFILPTIFITIMTPAVIKISTTLFKVLHPAH